MCESTYLHEDEALAREYGHMTAKEAGTLARDAGVGCVVLTHFSQRYRDVEPLRAEAATLHDNVIAANDGDRIPLPARKRPVS